MSTRRSRVVPRLSGLISTVVLLMLSLPATSAADSTQHCTVVRVVPELVGLDGPEGLLPDVAVHGDGAAVSISPGPPPVVEVVVHCPVWPEPPPPTPPPLPPPPTETPAPPPLRPTTDPVEPSPEPAPVRPPPVQAVPITPPPAPQPPRPTVRHRAAPARPLAQDRRKLDTATKRRWGLTVLLIAVGAASAARRVGRS